MPGKVIGVDLGTTHCRVAVMEGEQSVVIPNAFGERFTPNIVALTESGEWVVGREAEKLYRTAPEAAVSGITRFLGVTQSSSAFQEEAKLHAFQFVTSENNEPAILHKGTTLTFEEILIQLFRTLKWTAECYLGEEVTDSAIALATPWVPAAKSQIKKCAEVAGLQVLRIYTSAVMAAVGHDLGVLDERQILICDFGGGFCNAAVVSAGEGVFEVKSVEAARHVCGKTIDRALAAHLAIEFRKDKGIGLEGNRTAQERLRIAAEEAKIILSSLEETDVHVPLLSRDSSGRSRSLTARLSRQKVEELSSNLIREAQETCLKTLHASALKAEDLDEVILIGGMSRMPLVQKTFRERFGSKIRMIGTTENLVSKGAAMQGAVFTGQIKDILLLDVIPFSVGIETQGGLFEVLIPKNDTIPTRRTVICSTVHPGQPSAYVHLLVGESLRAWENSTLGGLKIDIVPGPKGVSEIEVTVDVDANGGLHVSAKDRTNGSEKYIRIGASTTQTREESLRFTIEYPLKPGV